MSNSEIQSYTVRVEDKVYRAAVTTVNARSAAEAVWIARRRACDGELNMRVQDDCSDDPWVYSVEGDNLPHTTSCGENCLCDRVDQLLELEGLPKEMADEIDEDFD